MLLTVSVHFGTEPAKRAFVIAVWLVIGLFLAASVCLGQQARAGDQMRHTVLKVYDGDTILVAGPDGRKLIRLLGIDAPETSKGKGKPGQPYSRKAQRHLADLILKRNVTLTAYGEDRYQRTLAVVSYEGRDINLAMIEAGLAEAYRGRTPEGFDKTPYLEAEARARQSVAGMWRQGDAYVSPNRWKHPH